MHRVFGKSKPKAEEKEAPPPPSLTEVREKGDAAIGAYTEKIDTIQRELAPLMAEIKRTRPGPRLKMLRQRASNMIKRRKMIESQRDQLYAQNMNAEMLEFNIDSAKRTTDMMAGMKAGVVALTAAQEALDIDDVYDLYDTMEEQADINTQMNDLLGTTVGGFDVDDSELDAELDGYAEEMASEGYAEGAGAGALPSYLAPAPTAEPVAEGAGAGADAAPLAAVPVDEFGLP